MRLWKKKLKTKKKEDAGWSISTKIFHGPENTLRKIRTNKIPWTHTIKYWYFWIKNYLKTVGWLFIGGLVLLGIFVIFATPIFTLKTDKIEVVLKPEPVFDRNAIESLLRDFAGKNIFSISTQDVFASLSENVRHIASVEKSLKLPDGIRVVISSFPPSYRAFIGEERFLLTENGQLIPDIPEVEAPALQIFHLVQDPSIGKKTPIMDEDMYGIRLILNAWKEKLSSSPIDELRFYEQEKELHIVTGGTHCIFSLEDGQKEVEILKTLTEKWNIVLSRLLYIDLRIPKRVYTCPRSENACSQNLVNIYNS